EATVAGRRAERAALAERVRGAVVAALGRASAQQQRYLRFRDEILPKSHEVEEMAQESYKVGHSPLSALLQALQAARELRGQALAAASEYQSALVELEQALTLGGNPGPPASSARSCGAASLPRATGVRPKTSTPRRRSRSRSARRGWGRSPPTYMPPAWWTPPPAATGPRPPPS